MKNCNFAKHKNNSRVQNTNEKSLHFKIVLICNLFRFHFDILKRFLTKRQLDWKSGEAGRLKDWERLPDWEPVWEKDREAGWKAEMAVEEGLLGRFWDSCRLCRNPDKQTGGDGQRQLDRDKERDRGDGGTARFACIFFRQATETTKQQSLRRTWACGLRHEEMIFSFKWPAASSFSLFPLPSCFHLAEVARWWRCWGSCSAKVASCVSRAGSAKWEYTVRKVCVLPTGLN